MFIPKVDRKFRGIRLYRVSFLWAAVLVGCLVEGCRGRSLTCTNLWIHFVYRHVWYRIVIMEEVNCPHPR